MWGSFDGSIDVFVEKVYYLLLGFLGRVRVMNVRMLCCKGISCGWLIYMMWNFFRWGF